MLLSMNSISSKHHLGNFIGADVLKEPGFYQLQESCLVKVPNSADLVCVCVTLWVLLMSKAIEKPSQTISEEISDTTSRAQYCPDHQPSRHIHVSASAWSLPASRPRGRDKYTKSYQLFKKLVWVSSQLSPDTRGRTPVPSD